MFKIDHEVETLIQKEGKIVLKYHNDMNVFSFGGFTARELNLFFLICGLMKEREYSLVLTFDEIKKIIGPTSFANNKDLIDCVAETNRKFLTLNGEYKKAPAGAFYCVFIFSLLLFLPGERERRRRCDRFRPSVEL